MERQDLGKKVILLSKFLLIPKEENIKNGQICVLH